MKLKGMLGVNGEGFVVVKDLRSKQIGAAVHASGKIVVVYESETGEWPAALSPLLREMADGLEKSPTPARDITPIIPEAEA